MTPPRLFLASLLAFFALFSRAEAARLYLTPANGTFQPGETVAVEVRVDNENECVNAAEVNIGYPKEYLEVVDISRGESIFTVWVSPPAARPEFGLVSFIGGIPGGYCGRIPGDPAVTNVLAKIVFRFSNGTADKMPLRVPVTVLPSSRVVLNDGAGTEAALSRASAELAVTTTGKPQKNEWTEELRNDTIPPEIFTVEVNRDRSIFDNKYFAVFSTVDKQTGLDRYEVFETRTKTDAELQNPEWRRADSPYVLKDQSLRSRVLVRAVDKAGNVRVSEYRPFAEREPVKTALVFWTIASIAVIFAIFRFVRFIPW